jgi:hypothetical protein
VAQGTRGKRSFAAGEEHASQVILGGVWRFRLGGGSQT